MARDTRAMSTQLTGNTCYFQAYLFALLCKVGEPALQQGGGRCVESQCTTTCYSRSAGAERATSACVRASGLKVFAP